MKNTVAKPKVFADWAIYLFPVNYYRWQSHRGQTKTAFDTGACKCWDFYVVLKDLACGNVRSASGFVSAAQCEICDPLLTKAWVGIVQIFLDQRCRRSYSV